MIRTRTGVSKYCFWKNFAKVRTTWMVPYSSRCLQFLILIDNKQTTLQIVALKKLLKLRKDPMNGGGDQTEDEVH